MSLTHWVNDILFYLGLLFVSFIGPLAHLAFDPPFPFFVGGGRLVSRRDYCAPTATERIWPAPAPARWIFFRCDLSLPRAAQLIPCIQLPCERPLHSSSLIFILICIVFALWIHEIVRLSIPDPLLVIFCSAVPYLVQLP